MKIRNRELFVAGFPRSTSLEEVFCYFKSFGSIVSVERIPTLHKNSNFKVTVADQSTYQAILHPHNPLWFLGRDLIARPFATGRQLVLHNINSNRCRVIATNVPSSIPKSEFEQWIRQMAGPVTKIYCYKSGYPGSITDLLPRHKKSYSILFAEKQSAKRLVGIKSWDFYRGVGPSIFQKYKAPKNGGKTKVIHPASTVVSRCIQSDLSSQLMEESQHYIQTQMLRGEVAGQSRPAIPQNLHSIRPNSKAYFLLRSPVDSDLESSSDNLSFRRPCTV